MSSKESETLCRAKLQSGDSTGILCHYHLSNYTVILNIKNTDNSDFKEAFPNNGYSLKQGYKNYQTTELVNVMLSLIHVELNKPPVVFDICSHIDATEELEHLV